MTKSFGARGIKYVEENTQTYHIYPLYQHPTTARPLILLYVAFPLNRTESMFLYLWARLSMHTHQQWRWGGARCKGHPPPHLNNISQRLEALVTAALHQQRHAEVACLEPFTHLHCAKGACSVTRYKHKAQVPFLKIKSALRYLKKGYVTKTA